MSDGLSVYACLPLVSNHLLSFAIHESCGDKEPPFFFFWVLYLHFSLLH